MATRRKATTRKKSEKQYFVIREDYQEVIGRGFGTRAEAEKEAADFMADEYNDGTDEVFIVETVARVIKKPNPVEVVEIT